jgi:hypothetical protein
MYRRIFNIILISKSFCHFYTLRYQKQNQDKTHKCMLYDWTNDIDIYILARDTMYMF